MDTNGDLFKASDLTQLNGIGTNSKKILTSIMTASEVEALNTAYGLTDTAAFESVANY